MRCSRCGEFKSTADFHIREEIYSDWCRGCRAEVRRAKKATIPLCATRKQLEMYRLDHAERLSAADKQQCGREPQPPWSRHVRQTARYSSKKSGRAADPLNEASDD